MTARSALVGYARKSRNGTSLKLSLSKRALLEAETYTTQDGEEFIRLVINLGKVVEVAQGAREVTSVVQVHGEGEVGEAAAATSPTKGPEGEE